MIWEIWWGMDKSFIVLINCGLDDWLWLIYMDPCWVGAYCMDPYPLIGDP
jgi:hypothetical protein